jgi:hypothetical protein
MWSCMPARLLNRGEERDATPEAATAHTPSSGVEKWTIPGALRRNQTHVTPRDKKVVLSARVAGA